MFTLRILIIFMMLIKCSIDDIRIGYVDMKYVIGATMVGGILMIIGGEIIGMGLLQLLFYIFAVLIIVINIFRMAMKKRPDKSEDEKALFLDKWIGRGDIYILLSLVIVLGLWRALVITTISFLLSSIYSIYLVGVKRLNINFGFPFVPFILAGYMVEIINLLISNDVA